MWILTSEHNDYNQYGEYFIFAWSSKPSIEELGKILKQGDTRIQPEYIEHVYTLGGRLNYEHIWYNFEEFTPYS